MDGEVVALDVSDSHYLSANLSGSMLWEALDRGTERAELVGMLKQEFGIDERVAERDVDAFLSDLAARGLLDQE